jgi:hypothetical protein
MAHTSQLTVVRPEPLALTSTKFLELKARSEHSVRAMDNRIACKKLAETSNLFVGPHQYRVCGCQCGVAILPGFTGVYASGECETRDRRAKGLKVRPKVMRERDSQKEGNPAPSPKVSRYSREGRGGEGYPPAKSRSQFRWARYALSEINAGRHVDTSMSVEEIRALAATPEDGLPWHVAHLKATNRSTLQFTNLSHLDHRESSFSTGRR